MQTLKCVLTRDSSVTGPALVVMALCSAEAVAMASAWLYRGTGGSSVTGSEGEQTTLLLLWKGHGPPLASNTLLTCHPN